MVLLLCAVGSEVAGGGANRACWRRRPAVSARNWRWPVLFVVLVLRLGTYVYLHRRKVHPIRHVTNAGGHHHGGARSPVCRTILRKGGPADIRSGCDRSLRTGRPGISGDYLNDVVGRECGAAFSALHEFA